MTMIGARARQIDWEAQTAGRFAYTADLPSGEALHAAVLRSPHPYARIDTIDMRAALAIPGVHAIVTIADFPAGVCYIHEGANDRPPMADGVVRFVGQEVAAVAAESEAAARAACAAIVVGYTIWPAPLDMSAALRRGASVLHARKTGLSNRSAWYHRQWGDAAAGIKAAAWQVRGHFRFAAQHQVCIEPSIVFAAWDAAAGRLNLWSPTAAPYYVARDVAHVLGLDQDRVICREIAVGGSFGARTKVCDYEAIAALLSMRTGRPIRLALSRAEDFTTTKSRHAFDIDLTLFGDNEGRLCAITGDLQVDNGAYDHSGGSVTSAGLKGLGMLYRPLGLDITAALIDTAKRPGGQFRGYGSTQTAFALESLVDELALKSRHDPLALRIANANRAGDVTLVGALIGTSGLAACLEACRDRIGWNEIKRNRSPGLGVGVASAIHVSGSFVGGQSNQSECAIDLHASGHAHVRFGSGDAGTGQKTILAQIVASELGLPIAAVGVEMIDSARTPFDMGSWSSRGTHYSGHAARGAALQLRRMLMTAVAADLENGPLRFEDGAVIGTASRIPIGDAAMRCAEASEGVLSVRLTYTERTVEPADAGTGAGNISATYNFAAHAALVEVCRLTGKVRLRRYVAAHDVGAAINPGFVEGQIIGGAAMGIGAALGEEIVIEQGRVANGAFVNYAMPRAADLPPIEAVIVPIHDPAGPYGAKGVGETGVNPPPAAIANAIRDAIGIRLTETPFTPDKILGALRAAAGTKRAHNLLLRPSRWWIAVVRWFYPRGLFRLLHRRVAGRYPEQPPVPISRIDSPATIDALRVALGEGAKTLGGGIDLLALRQQGHPVSERLATVASVQGMDEISRNTDGSVRIGAAVTLARLVQSLGNELPVLREAVETIASPQVRAVATVGGNLLQEKRC